MVDEMDAETMRLMLDQVLKENKQLKAESADACQAACAPGGYSSAFRRPSVTFRRRCATLRACAS
mgnify:CR=1 FL=1